VFEIRGARRDIMAWPAWHDNYKYLTWRDDRFVKLERPVHVLWGTLGVDRAHTSTFDEESLGEVIYDGSFDAADPQAQLALWRACDQIAHADELHVIRDGPNVAAGDGKTRCFIGAFRAWLHAHNKTFPQPRGAFETLLPQFVWEQPHWLGTLSIESDAASGRWRLRHVLFTFHVVMRPHAPAGIRRVQYDRWRAMIERLNREAPPSAKHAIHTGDGRWLAMAILEQLMSVVQAVVATSLTVGFCFMLVCTGSLTIAMLCTLTLGGMLLGWTGVAQASGMLEQGMGVVESLVFMVSVGLMLDPIAHVAFAFAEASQHGHASREAKVRYAFSTIGVSVLAGGASTLTAISVLLMGTIIFFSRFATLFCSLQAMNLVYTHFFLAPLLLLAGPAGTDLGGAPWRVCGLTRKRSTASVSRSLKDADAASEQAAAIELGPTSA